MRVSKSDDHSQARVGICILCAARRNTNLTGINGNEDAHFLILPVISRCDQTMGTSHRDLGERGSVAALRGEGQNRAEKPKPGDSANSQIKRKVE